MVCFMETISRDVQRHEPLQFSVITIFHGKAAGVINNVWVIVNLKSSCYKGSFQKRFSGFCPLRGLNNNKHNNIIIVLSLVLS